MTATVRRSRCKALLGTRRGVAACRSGIDARARAPPGGFGASQWLIDNLGPLLSKTFTPGNAKKARACKRDATSPLQCAARDATSPLQLRTLAPAESGIAIPTPAPLQLRSREQLRILTPAPFACFARP